MIPAILAVVAVRAIASAAGQKQSTSSDISRHTGVALCKLVAMVVATILLSVDNSLWFKLAVLAGCWLFAMPTLFLRYSIVPLGLPRLAYYVARWCWPLQFVYQNVSGAVIYSLLAWNKPTERNIAWLETRLAKEKTPGAATQVAMGLIASRKGDRSTARVIFEAVDQRPPYAKARFLRVIAREWLVADAAAAGRWDEVATLGRRGRASHRWSYLMARIAERLTWHPKAPSAWLLCLLWLLAPRRIDTLSLLHRALTNAAPPRRQQAKPPADLPTALANLHQLLSQAQSDARTVSSADFVHTLKWVDIRLASPDLGQRLALRSRQLDPIKPADPNVVLAAFRAQLISLVVPLIEAHPHLIVEGRDLPVIQAALDQIREKAFEQIESQCQDYEHRGEAEQTFESYLEWQNWARLRDSAERLRRLAPEAEATLFNTLYRPVCNFAVYQHNVLKRHPLSADMFGWLLKHAPAGSPAHELLTKNLSGYGSFH